MNQLVCKALKLSIRWQRSWGSSIINGNLEPCHSLHQLISLDHNHRQYKCQSLHRRQNLVFQSCNTGIPARSKSVGSQRLPFYGNNYQSTHQGENCDCCWWLWWWWFGFNRNVYQRGVGDRYKSHLNCVPLCILKPIVKLFYHFLEIRTSSTKSPVVPLNGWSWRKPLHYWWW